MTSTSSLWALNYLVFQSIDYEQGRIQDFKIGGAHLKKLRRAEGDAKIFGVFRVKNNDFTPKNHISSNCGGRREICLGVSCEKSRFYAKMFFFPILGGGGGAPGASPLDPPLMSVSDNSYSRKAPRALYYIYVFTSMGNIHRISFDSRRCCSISG
jgi:hypothetical protein